MIKGGKNEDSVVNFILKIPFIYEVYEDSVLKGVFKSDVLKHEDTLTGEFLKYKSEF